MAPVIRLVAVVGEDRRLTIELPPDIPVGPVELTIRPTREVGDESLSSVVLAREAARVKMRAAGFLSTAHRAPTDARALALEERIRIGTMAPGARPSEELVDEDRGAY